MFPSIKGKNRQVVAITKAIIIVIIQDRYVTHTKSRFARVTQCLIAIKDKVLPYYPS